MKLFVDKKDCCGCAACANICPKSAITMEKDEIGQYYPRINEALCVDCGTCMRVCDFQKKDENQFGHQVLSAYGAAWKEEINENNITYHDGRNRQPIWNRNKTVGAGR